MSRGQRGSAGRKRGERAAAGERMSARGGARKTRGLARCDPTDVYSATVGQGDGRAVGRDKRVSRDMKRAVEAEGGCLSLERMASRVDAEDDEEVESDDAFDAEDEEKFSQFAFAGSKASLEKAGGSRKPTRRPSGSGGEEDDEAEERHPSDDEETSGEAEPEAEEGMVDLSEILAGDPDECLPGRPPASRAEAGLLNPVEDEQSDGPFDDGVPSELSSAEESEDEHGLEAVDRLDRFVESLAAKEDETGEPARKRRLAQRSEAYEESEFSLPAVADGDPSSARSKLELGDLLAAVGDETAFTGLKKQMQVIKTKSSAKTLDAPLPKRLQDKVNRAAAFAEAKEEVSKWQDIVKRNREADHLSFPMNRPSLETPSIAKLGQAALANSMEREVNKVLVQSGIQEKDIQRFEELELNKMSAKEVEARRQELRLMRELMFREEIKAKRVSKIKSKAYRRLKRKDRERNALSTEQLEEIDPEAARERQMKAEMERAKERMTLKHRNTAKNMLKRPHHDTETRQAISESLERHEALKRKIQCAESGDEDRSSDDDEVMSGDEQAIRDHTLRKLDAFEQSLEAEEAPKVGKGLFQMKFMKDAAARKKKEALAHVRELREELEAAAAGSDEELAAGDREQVEDAGGSASVTKVGGNPGRMIFSSTTAPAVSASALGPYNDHAQIPKTSSTSASVPVEVVLPSSTISPLKSGNHTDEEENPWLKAPSSKKQAKNPKRKRGANEPSMEERLQHKVKKLNSVDKVGMETVDVDLDTLITVKGEEVVAARPPSPKPARSSVPNGDVDASDDDEVVDDATAAPLVHSGDRARVAFTQRELVQMAFAGDNVVEEFENEKREIERGEDKPEEGPTMLPGWGTWGGIGVKPKNNKPPPAHKNLAPKKAPNRKDAKLKHVIINEKKNKKAAKYTVARVPYPFTSKEQYELSRRVPLGREWVTASAHSKMIKPRVMTKQGAVIDPLTAPF